ncbi:MAG: CoA transferase [SAR202 cluster bacterium]|nr:carnitine dehydratase [Chloroflexota bacterium]MQG51757.1 CoA transferase [SAR202 cluster bacterium]|tara:strand:- start:2507 stop:3727 length:1221 start_codon:yes stop_codon:yes gene_type:complete
MEGNMAGPLEGVKIIDFTHWLAGPFGTMILCDLGAEVIHVERITATDSNRGDGPYVNGISSYRYSLERGKKSIQVDLKDPTGLQIVKDLINKADVVTENFSVGVMEKLGLGYEQFEDTNPGLIYASCSGYGQTGPRAQQGAFDVIAQGFSGLMSITGEPDGRPMRVGTSVGDTFGGTYMALGILSALYERDRSGKGQKIDVSMVESVIYNLENAIIRYSITGQIPQRIGTRHPLITPFQTFETANGYICIAGLRDWEAFCFILGLEELAADDRFNTGEKRTQNHGALEPILTESLKKQTTQHWIEVLDGIAVCGPINNLEEMIEDPHIKARNSIVTLPVPGENEQQVKVSNTPVRLSRTPADVSKRAFVVGEHTKSILNEWLDYDDSTIIDLEEKGILKSSDNEFI